MPNCKSFLVTEAEWKHVRRHGRFQQLQDASSHQFFSLKGKALKEIHAQYHPHKIQQTSHPITNTTMIPSTPQSTNIPSCHKHYHDTAHTPVNKHHIPPSPTLPRFCPHPNQQTSHPTITNTTTIPFTPVNKHHIPPSPTLSRYRPHPNQKTSLPTVTNTTRNQPHPKQQASHPITNMTMIPSTPQSTNITSPSPTLL